jgi:hypothetical protein
MGMFGNFAGKWLGTKPAYHSESMQMNNRDYNKALDQSEATALASSNRGDATGNRQMSLADTLNAQASGQTPSLAQMQLQAGADQNLKNSAALMASQRGINPAQAARQVAMSHQATGQQLANDIGQLRLNEQMQKQNLLAGVLDQARNQDINQQQANTQLYGTVGGLNNQQTQNQLQNYWGAESMNNQAIAQASRNRQGLMSGLLNQAGGALSMFAAHGGMVNGYAGGGLVDVPDMYEPVKINLNPIKKDEGGGGDAKEKGFTSGSGGFDLGSVAKLAPLLAFSQGGNVPVQISPEEKIQTPDGKMYEVSGKAKYAGDDYRNDTVMAKVPEGSIVVPRTKASDKHKTMEFLKDVKKMSMGGDNNGMETILKNQQELMKKLAIIEKKLGKK